MTIWQRQRTISNQLLGINLVNALVGLSLSQKTGFWAGFGKQSFGWAIINIGIAIGGRLMLQKRFNAIDNPDDRYLVEKETHSLKRILRINAGLDLLYMLGGQQFAARFGKTDAGIRGHGWAIVTQGFSLFTFDLLHLRRLKQD